MPRGIYLRTKENQKRHRETCSTTIFLEKIKKLTKIYSNLPEERERRSFRMLGDKNPMRREESLRKVLNFINDTKTKEIWRLNNLGSKNPFWKGGISFESYKLKKYGD
jgi:hypothetical protein